MWKGNKIFFSIKDKGGRNNWNGGMGREREKKKCGLRMRSRTLSAIRGGPFRLCSNMARTGVVECTLNKGISRSNLSEWFRAARKIDDIMDFNKRFSTLFFSFFALLSCYFFFFFFLLLLLLSFKLLIVYTPCHYIDLHGWFMMELVLICDFRRRGGRRMNISFEIKMLRWSSLQRKKFTNNNEFVRSYI